MRKRQGWRTCVLLAGGLGCLMLSACATVGSQSPPAVAEQPANTPRAAILAAFTAMKDGDTAKLIAVCRTTRKQRESLAAEVAMIAAANRFHDRLVAVYGPAAWEEFSTDHHISDGKMRFTLANYVDRRQITELEGASDRRVRAAKPIAHCIRFAARRGHPRWRRQCDASFLRQASGT